MSTHRCTSYTKTGSQCKRIMGTPTAYFKQNTYSQQYPLCSTHQNSDKIFMTGGVPNTTSSIQKQSDIEFVSIDQDTRLSYIIMLLIKINPDDKKQIINIHKHIDTYFEYRKTVHTKSNRDKSENGNCNQDHQDHQDHQGCKTHTNSPTIIPCV